MDERMFEREKVLAPPQRSTRSVRVVSPRGALGPLAMRDTSPPAAAHRDGGVDDPPSPEGITPTALFGKTANGTSEKAPSSAVTERTSSTKKMGLVKDQLELVEVRQRDGSVRNEVRDVVVTTRVTPLAPLLTLPVSNRNASCYRQLLFKRRESRRRRARDRASDTHTRPGVHRNESAAVETRRA